MKGLGLSFRCALKQAFELARILAAHGVTPATRRPTRFDHQGEVEPPPPDWVAVLRRDTEPMAHLMWSDNPRMQLSVSARLVTLEDSDHEWNVPSILRLASTLPFRVAVGAPLYWEWEAEDQPTPYTAPRIGDAHFPLGWCMIFRGDAHREHLVSRRWLEHGPWQVFRGEHDTTLVLFHDPAADEPTARAQAKPGHQRLANDAQSGYLQRPHPFVLELDKLTRYDAATKTLLVPADGRKLPASEMQELAAVRGQQHLGPDKVVEHVAYVFTDEAQAREQLAPLWLYEHQVWLERDGKRKRLDADHKPTTKAPAWVTARAAHPAPDPTAWPPFNAAYELE